jgi:hypothetical protein
LKTNPQEAAVADYQMHRIYEATSDAPKLKNGVVIKSNSEVDIKGTIDPAKANGLTVTFDKQSEPENFYYLEIVDEHIRMTYPYKGNDLEFRLEGNGAEYKIVMDTNDDNHLKINKDWR